MDLNELYFRHQIALMRATCAASQPDKERHAALARDLAARIAAIQRRAGASVAPLMAAQELCL